MWGIWGGSSVDKNKASTKDRPPLAVYLDQLLSREAANVSVESKENAKNISLSSSFLVVPLDTIGKRVDHNAEICASLISFFEERTRQLQKTLKDMRKKSPIVPVRQHPEFCNGSIEHALVELNRIHESEAMQVNGRLADLELRVRQQLSMSRENAVGCGVDYEAEIHRVEKDSSKAREKLQRCKAVQQRAVERLASAHAKSFETSSSSSSSSLLSAVRPSRQVSDADIQLEIADASEQLEVATKTTREACEQLLVCMRKQDQVVAAAALGFEACDYRCRGAIGSALSVFVDIEIEAASKRLEDLSKLAHKLKDVNVLADSKKFVSSAKQPDSTHSSSAALCLLHDPDNRGALVGMATPKSVPNSHGRPNLPYGESPKMPQPLKQVVTVPPTAAADEDEDGEEVNDRTLEDMEVIVTALFKSGPRKETVTPPPVPQQPLDTDHPLHPLQFAEKPTSVGPLLSGNQKRRFTKLLELPMGREALVHALNQQRSKRTEIEHGFDELAIAMSYVLDKCRENHDVHNAKMAMMLSQTFYRETVIDGASESSRKGREYLKSALISHPLWEDMKFWDEACWQSISESVKEGQTGTLWHDMKPPEQRDAVLRIHNIVFSQVGAYAHSMLEFGCKPALAKKFVLRLAATYELAEDQIDMLLDLVQSAAQTK